MSNLLTVSLIIRQNRRNHEIVTTFYRNSLLPTHPLSGCQMSTLHYVKILYFINTAHIYNFLEQSIPNDNISLVHVKTKISFKKHITIAISPGCKELLNNYYSKNNNVFVKSPYATKDEKKLLKNNGIQNN